MEINQLLGRDGEAEFAHGADFDLGFHAASLPVSGGARNYEAGRGSSFWFGSRSEITRAIQGQCLTVAFAPWARLIMKHFANRIGRHESGI